MEQVTGRGPGRAVMAARVRVPLTALGVLLLLIGVLVPGAGWLAVGGSALTVAGLVLYFRLGTVRSDPVPLQSPVLGRWVAVNSPASRIPSHGLHAYGQTYAVDLVHVPRGDWALSVGWSGPHTRDPAEYPGWGEPVLAPADGTVVRVQNTRRDHRARTSYLGLALMLAEGIWLELTGRILGNHVVVRVDPDCYIVVAHLRRGSVRVRPGQSVTAGEQLAECGNSGNASEPHVHLQVMDRPGVAVAAGLPMRFVGVRTDGGEPVEMPANEQAMVA